MTTHIHDTHNKAAVPISRNTVSSALLSRSRYVRLVQYPITGGIATILLLVSDKAVRSVMTIQSAGRSRRLFPSRRSLDNPGIPRTSAGSELSPRLRRSSTPDLTALHVFFGGGQNVSFCMYEYVCTYTGEYHKHAHIMDIAALTAFVFVRICVFVYTNTVHK